MRYLRWLAFVALAAPVACDGPADAPDAGPVSAVLRYCPLAFNRTFVLDTFKLVDSDAPREEGSDHAFAPIAEIVNNALEEAIDKGSAIYLIDISVPADPSDPRGSPVNVDFYLGIDGELPADPDNNHTGSGEFIVDTSQFRSDGTPIGRFETATWIEPFGEPPVIVASDSTWDISSPFLPNVVIADGSVRIALDEELTHITDGRGSGALTHCGLSKIPAPGGLPGTLLDLLLDHPDLGVAADIDNDGDGMETIVEQGEVATCFDGDGTALQTPYPLCACDSRMADAFSLAVRFTAVRARILGVVGEGCDP